MSESKWGVVLNRPDFPPSLCLCERTRVSVFTCVTEVAYGEALTAGGYMLLFVSYIIMKIRAWNGMTVQGKASCLPAFVLTP